MKDWNEYRDLLLEKRAFANFAIVRKNGHPHVTPLWFETTENDLKNNIIRINTATTRVKSNNLEIGTPVSMSIVDPDNNYRYIGINGAVEEMIMGKEANDHIDDLNFKYQGTRPYSSHKPGQERIKVIIKIESTY